MTVGRDVLAFLRDPAAFAAAPSHDVDGHDAALATIIGPAIARSGDHPLRPAQEQAWHGLAALRSGLLLGPPGTGKTHLLSWLVLGHGWARAGAGHGSKTLLTAFTRSAVETLMGAVAKRANSGVAAPRLVYLGRPRGGDLPPDVAVVTSDRRGWDDELGRLLEAPSVVLGGTVWGLYEVIRRGCIPGRQGPTAPFFDLVAIDEASQMVLGHGLLALAGLAADGRVIVAGDDRQLPPIRAAQGLEIDGREVGGSLYAFLKAARVPEFALEETFRLNAPLAAFPERRFYPGIYRSAEPNRRLSMGPDWRRGLEEWERAALDPDLPTVVIVHDGPPAATHSPFEVEVAGRLADLFRDAMTTRSGERFRPESFWTEGLALVSPHRAQNAALRRRLASGGPGTAFAETVDRIQGRERDAVILSYTVSDLEFALAEGDFIFSPERLNVGITRARSKLVVIVSRRLLDVVPTRQEVLDKAEVLREFVFACPAILDAAVGVGEQAPVRVTVRASGFPVEAGAAAAPDPVMAPPILVADTDLEPALKGVLDAVRRLSANKKGRVSLVALQGDLDLAGGLAAAFAAVRRLHALGWVRAWHWDDGRWSVGAFDFPRRRYPIDDADFDARVISEAGYGGCAYLTLRERFHWMPDAASGRDLLFDRVRDLAARGRVRLEDHEWDGRRWLKVHRADAAEPGEPAMAVAGHRLSDSDFVVLNALEDVEAERIEAGVFEVWSWGADVARRLGMPVEAVAGALSRLGDAAHVLLADDGRVRSRMAELARELRHIKQRFHPGDADRRPYLVRSVKVRLRDRVKPIQDVALAAALDGARERHRDDVVAEALAGLGQALGTAWARASNRGAPIGEDPEPVAGPSLAGFQVRGFDAILAAWLGSGEDDAFVVAADTGSGKTEAAVLPIIAGACVDALRGVGGVRAILAYPRVRLAANQSQRLAGYLAALAGVPRMPLLTLGAQFSEIPRSWSVRPDELREAGYVRSPRGWTFPLFACPVRRCGSPLEVLPGGGDRGADRLDCVHCGWTYGGWVGTKRGLREAPPTLFLPTIDSLNQWMQDPNCGRLFGDVGGSAPRAFLADEIHLYSHVHGAQVAYAMRRLLTRAQANDARRRPCLAIGMSATLGDPARAFSRLVGRDRVHVVAPEDRETPVNPRGREYFYFVQPEVESRDRDVAGASTAIQTLMCLAHGMRRRRGEGSGYRALAFLDSIDKVRRLQTSYTDAERQELAALRTRRYDDAPGTGRPRDACCGAPAACEAFRGGECWYFAATDRGQTRADGATWGPGAPLAVARRPVTSATKEGVEAMIRASDIVFATSSLEVGYDDPDIGLVFQHYGPQNLASFIQRKGRGGRGGDDRPTTAVTLSIYSPRDAYWFHRPDLMLDARGYEAPLNPDNHFVRRAQILCQLLDGLAAYEASTGDQPWTCDAVGISTEALAAAVPAIERVFGPAPWTAYDCPTLGDLWALAVAETGGGGVASARDARNMLPWVPVFLHDTVNLPSLSVALPFVQDGERRVEEGEHDIAYTFHLLAPGNVTRRFHPAIGAWRPPCQGRGPWLADDDYHDARSFSPCGPDPAALLAELPEYGREAVGPNLRASVLRPRRMTLERAGAFAAAGIWRAAVNVDPRTATIVGAGERDGLPSLHHESRGHLDGCLIVRTTAPARVRHEPPNRPSHVRHVDVFTAGRDGTGATGLRVATVAWGAESNLRLDPPQAGPGARTNPEPVSVRQVFTDPRYGEVALHGFQVETEGIQVAFDGDRIDAFVERELGGASRGSAWQRLHMARAETLVRLRRIGVTSYDADRVAAIVGYLATHGRFEEGLRRMTRFPDARRIRDMFQDLRQDVLPDDPLMTASRVDAAAALASERGPRNAVRDALAALGDAAAWRRYLRSVLLNGLSLRWRQLFVLLAQGDERRVNVHVKLPIDYGAGSSDVVTVAEVGESGDGTTRAFAARLGEAWDRWADGFAASCPNALEDAALDRFFAMRSQHDAWLALHPRDQAGLRAMGRELSPGGGDASVPASVSRILFDRLNVGGRQFGVYDVALGVREVRDALEDGLGRIALPWELTSAIASGAAEGRGPAALSALFDAYGSMPGEVDGEGSLSPRSRFADQAFRMGARLCPDGCRACVHQDGGALGGALGDAMVSRGLVTRYLAAP